MIGKDALCGDDMTIHEITDLKYIIENELFISCRFLPANRFIQYCRDRSIRTSKKQLEQFEKLRIFYPIARVQYPKIKYKVEYIDDGKRYRRLGILGDGEEWNGDIREEYAHFWFEKEYAEHWLEGGLLWKPSSRPFQPWETFIDDDGYGRIESFYSIFQCYSLFQIIQSLGIEFRMEYEIFPNKKDFEKLMSTLKEKAEHRISFLQKNRTGGELAAIICQIISNRYFPLTQTDHRSFLVPVLFNFSEWDWYEYCTNWDAQTILDEIGISCNELKGCQESISLEASTIDPLQRWYDLVSFVSMEKKKELKGKALFAQTLYSMEHMLRLFYEDLTGVKLYPPDESPFWKKDNFYGEGVTENELQHLEYLTNLYHLNPRPKLILVVEGNGEENEFPRLVEGLSGLTFARLGIEVRNIQGVGGFTGKERSDRYGALEKFIDEYHYRQTIVFVVLDNEGRVPTIKERLVQARSRHFPRRSVTKDEYIHVWKRNIEFDNFSHKEIAQAMTEICEGRYRFKAEEIADCHKRFEAGETNSLEKLFEEKVDYGLSKPELLRKLFELIISHREGETNNDGKAKRPVVQVLQKVIELASINRQPITQEIWQKNQESGYFGDLLQ